ncbi:hypothetical protein E4U47_004029, partial [Claviceps purpurea]
IQGLAVAEDIRANRRVDSELRRLGTDTMAKAEVQRENEAYCIMYGWDSALSRFRLPVVCVYLGGSE